MLYVYCSTYVDFGNDNCFGFFFLFPSLSTLQGGLNSFRGTLRCEYRNAEKDVV